MKVQNRSFNNFLSDKISENDRPFSSRSEKTIPQFENRTLLENSRLAEAIKN